MKLKTKALIVALAASPLLVAGCATVEDREAAAAAKEADIAARQGAEVDRVCFTRSINGWRPVSEKSVLLRQGVTEWYKLDLIGTCDPRFAFETIALRQRPAGGLCLTPGDRLDTFDRSFGGSCAITKIYEWNDGPLPDAQTDEAASAEGNTNTAAEATL